MKPGTVCLLAAVVAAAGLGGCHRPRPRTRTSLRVDRPSSAPTRPPARIVVSLDPATQGLIGLKTAPLITAEVPPLAKVPGRVLDRKASAAAYRRAVAERGGRPGPASSWTNQITALVRLDPARGLTLPTWGDRVQLLIPGAKRTTPGFCLGAQPAASGPGHGERVLVIVSYPPPDVHPGTTVVGFIPRGGTPVFGVVVPDGAVVRSRGLTWVYLQASRTDFVHQAITLLQPTASGWLVSGRVAPGDRVVVAGVSTLWSRERKSAFPLTE